MKVEASGDLCAGTAGATAVAAPSKHKLILLLLLQGATTNEDLFLYSPFTH